MNKKRAPTLKCLSSGFLLKHSLKQQTNSNETKVRRKRAIGLFDEEDYSHDSYALIYDYHDYQDDSYYAYDGHNLGQISIAAKDRDTYEEAFRKFQPTAHDPSRRRAFGTRIRRKKITTPLTTADDNNNISSP